ncbi:hypothetical protein CRYUN_Cryun13aG0065900 [Craigia yunnanensis]
MEVGNLKSLVELNVSHNELSGEIPSDLGSCASLQYLYMDHNCFTGELPNALISLRGIEEIHLSHNNLTGKIPKDFATFPFLQKLNLSFNDFQGDVPVLVLVLFAVLFYWFKKQRKRSLSKSSPEDPFMKISFGDLLTATNGFSSGNLIGRGSFGSVYEGILEQDQTAVAVKSMAWEAWQLQRVMCIALGLTGKRPIDDMFRNGLNLHKLVKMSLPDKVEEIVDRTLLFGEAAAAPIHECLISVLRIGEACSEELPRDRMEIHGALNQLLKLKDHVFLQD